MNRLATDATDSGTAHKRKLTSREESNQSPCVNWWGASPAMCRLDEQLMHVARSDHSILITGESGTGKTTAARVIHQRSGRTSARLVEINCAALPDNLIESELFGFEKGAFTGATERKKGLFEVAHGGTLFLDEIGELKHELQAKLLKAIDDGKIRRLGGVTDINCDVRLIAASSRNVPRMIALGTFREDLYYRIAVFEIYIPPLRERAQDIPNLVHTQLRLEQALSGRVAPLNLDEGALKELCDYSWPGNIRQLQNVLARLAWYAGSRKICVADVRAELRRFNYLESDTIVLPDSCSTLFTGESLASFCCRTRAAVIETVKTRTNGNVSRAAQRLQLTRAGLYKIEGRINARRGSQIDDRRSLGLPSRASSHKAIRTE